LGVFATVQNEKKISLWLQVAFSLKCNLTCCLLHIEIYTVAIVVNSMVNNIQKGVHSFSITGKYLVDTKPTL
jgi:hypothetical protein